MLPLLIRVSIFFTMGWAPFPTVLAPGSRVKLFPQTPPAPSSFLYTVKKWGPLIFWHCIKMRLVGKAVVRFGKVGTRHQLAAPAARYFFGQKSVKKWGPLIFMHCKNMKPPLFWHCQKIDPVTPLREDYSTHIRYPLPVVWKLQPTSVRRWVTWPLNLYTLAVIYSSVQGT